MKERLLSVLAKYKKPIRVTLWSLVAIFVLLAVLTYVPITRTLHYDMRGFIVSPDGEILEEFDFTITGKDYNFIIDPPGGSISFSGNKLTQLERDAFILTFDWGASSIAKKGISGHFTDDYRHTDTQMHGMLSYYDPSSNSYEWDSGMFDTDSGNFCVYSDVLADNAFIIGVSDPDADPIAVRDSYLGLVHIPDLESTPKS